MTLEWLVHSILNSKGKTQKMELRRLLKLTKPCISISAWGYTKARLKVDPGAFVYLNDLHVGFFYEDRDETFRDYKGYLPVAIDRTDLHLPATTETALLYDNANSRSEYPVVMASASCAFDVCNHIIMDAVLCPYKRCERDSAREHIQKITNTYAQKTICLFDRGYPSTEFLMELMEAENHFLFRLGSTTFQREQQRLSAEDAWIDIVLDKSRINPYRGTALAEKMQQTKKLHLRMARITLKNGTTEFLLSNLPDEEFTTGDLAELYRLRWEIETMYDTLKNKLNIENFSGKLNRLIQQDFHATIYLYNLIGDIQRGAESLLPRRHTKYARKINQNMAIGIIKEGMLQMATARSGTIRGMIYLSIIKEIQAYTVPVRPDRHFPRNTTTRKTKHSINRKASY